MISRVIYEGTETESTLWSDRVASIFVWGVWLVMLLVAFVCFALYSHNIPITEDWLLVPPLTGHEPNLLGWLWAQNNEHRIPFPRLILLGLLKATHGDFRAGMVFNIMILGAMAFAMISVVRHIRGARTRFADAFFPIALLHLGNWENLFWSWQLTQIVPTVLTCVILLVLVRRQDLASPGSASIAGVCLVLLPLCGANGLLVVPLLIVWLGYCGVVQWRAAKAEGGRRRVAGILIGSAVLSLALTGLYFVGYERPSWTPPNPGLMPSLQATMQFLALGFGPVARSWWELSMLVAVVVLLPSAVVAILGVVRHKGLERRHALGVLVFFGSIGAFALAVGWGRAGVIAIYGSWPIRYVLLAVPAFCTVYFIWELYGPPALRTVVQSGLFLGMCLLIPSNTTQGFWWNDWYQAGASALEQDLSNGVPRSTLAERNREFLFHSMDPSSLAELMSMLQTADIGPFANLRDDSSTPAGAALDSTATPGQPLVTQQIRYHIPQAGEVFLLWGVNGWQTVPEAARPSGTEIKDKLMRTPMNHVNDDFVVEVQVPAGANIDYGFLITKKRDGTAAPMVWDGDYHTASSHNAVAVQAKVTLPEYQMQESIPSLVNQEIRYHMAEAGEVFLVWGVDGWQALPEANRPAGTVIKNKLMYTPMTRNGDTFVTEVQVPTGSKIDYGFSITKQHDGVGIKEVWDGSDDYQLTAKESRVIEVEAKVVLSSDGIPARAIDAPLVTQEIRYHMAEAGEVFLVWGVDGWQALPEANRPAGTMIKNKVMRTPMNHEDDLFVARVQVPSGSKLEYGFAITKKRNGASIDEMWDGGDNYELTVREAGVADAYSTLELPGAWLDIWLDMLWQWRWPLLAGIVLLGVVLALRRQLRNPFLDY